MLLINQLFLLLFIFFTTLLIAKEFDNEHLLYVLYMKIRTFRICKVETTNVLIPFRSTIGIICETRRELVLKLFININS